MTRTYTDTKKANAGAPIACAGGVFAGPLAEREGDVFLQFRASRLVKGFENAAPAWLAKRSPATNLIRVYP